MQDKKGGKKHKYARLEEWGMHEVDKNSFLYSGFEGVARGLDTERDESKPRSKYSKPAKDLEKAAVGTHSITNWLDKEVPATVGCKFPLKMEESKYPHCPKERETIEWSGTGIMFLEYFPTEECEPIDVCGTAPVAETADVCGTAPVAETTAGVGCVKDEEGYADVMDDVVDVVEDVVEKGVMTVENVVMRKKAVKVWVKLKNGLFGWRTRRTAIRRTKNVERLPPLALAENFIIDEKNGKDNIQTKSKFNSGGVLGESKSESKDCDLEREDYAKGRPAAKKLRTE